MQNLSSLVTDRIDTAMALDMAPQRLNDLLDGKEPITPEIATFIEETLNLNPGILDREKSSNQPQLTVVTAAPRPEEPAMPAAQAATRESIVTIRCDNVDRLGTAARGVKAGICRQLGRGDNLFSLLRSHKVSFDDKLARQIEGIVGVPSGWLDAPQKNVPTLAQWVYTKGSTPAPAPARRVVHRAARKSVEVPLPPAPGTAAAGKAGGEPGAAPPAPEASSGNRLVDAMVETVRAYASRGLVDDRKAIKILSILEAA